MPRERVSEHTADIDPDLENVQENVEGRDGEPGEKDIETERRRSMVEGVRNCFKELHAAVEKTKVKLSMILAELTGTNEESDPYVDASLKDLLDERKELSSRIYHLINDDWTEMGKISQGLRQMTSRVNVIKSEVYRDRHKAEVRLEDCKWDIKHNGDTRSSWFRKLVNYGENKRMDKELSDAEIELQKANDNLQDINELGNLLHHSQTQISNAVSENISKTVTQFLDNIGQKYAEFDKSSLIAEAEEYVAKSAPESPFSGGPLGYKEIVHLMVQTDMAQKLQECSSLVPGHVVEEYRRERILESSLDRTLNSMSYKTNNRAVERIIRSIHDIELSTVELMHRFREDEAFKAMFGEEMGAIDASVYERALKDSVSMTAFPKMLKEYPTPESIRNLCLLVATNDTPNGRELAMQGLQELLKTERWEEVLADAEREYPEITATMSLLGTWEVMYPGDFRQASSLPISVYKKFAQAETETDKDTAKLAIRAMANEDLLGVALEEGMISAGISEQLSPLMAIFEAREKAKGYPSNLSNVYRKIMTARLTGADDDNWSVEKILIPLARLIMQKEQEGDPDAVDKLQGHSLITKLYTHAYGRSEYKQVLGEQMDTLGGDVERYNSLAFLPADLFDYQMFQNQKGLDYLLDVFLGVVMEKSKNHIVLMRLVGEGRLSADWALGLVRQKHDLLSGPLGDIFMSFPNIFVADEHAVAFSESVFQSYGKNAIALRLVTSALNEGKITPELVKKLPAQLPTLIDPESIEAGKLLNFALQNPEHLLDSKESISFVNSTIGLYGNRAKLILEGVIACRKEGVVNSSNIGIIHEFLGHFRVVSPSIIRLYIDSKKTNQEELLISELTSVSERLVSSKSSTESDRQKPYFNDLIRHVYPENAGNWSDYEKNSHCLDRSGDISQYSTKPKYEIDLFGAGTVSLKEGQEIDSAKLEQVKEQILLVERQFAAFSYDPQKMVDDLDLKIDKMFSEMETKPNDAERPFDREEKLFMLISESLYGTGESAEDIKKLVIQYEFALFEDVRDYIAGTSDRVSNASNKEYALLCELNSFFGDRVKEVYRRIAEKSFENEDIKESMKGYFESFSSNANSLDRKEKLNRLQIDKLGMTDQFAFQIKRTLEQKTGKTYSPEKVQKIIRLYESMVGDFSDKESTSTKKRTKALYGQLKSQRDKTIRALAELTGTYIDPESIHLGELNVRETIGAEQAILSGRYDEDQFASYTIERMIGLFGDEQMAVDNELAKFESSSGKVGQKLNAYITKTKESANARMVGGVCVSGDNPNKGEKNIWNMENYFQMVFQDPESLQCQGLVLLHSVDTAEGKVLTASLNPSSTYLYGVDETALFGGIMGSLETFANENGFDRIALSSNKAIRTNRTGGAFENAIDARLRKLGKSFKFETPQQFSYHPNYLMQEMDVIWEK